MASWFHQLKGKYDIGDKFIALDFAKHFLHPLEAELTFYHEVAHGAMAASEFGQATQVFVKLRSQFSHFSEVEQDDISAQLMNSQVFVQEGFATLLQMLRLTSKTNKNNAWDWAHKNLPDEYIERVSKLGFVFDLPPKRRDLFTGKISTVALETGIRKLAPTLGILENPEKLRAYLSDEQNCPDARLKKMIDTLRYKPWLLTKSPQEIAQACGLTYHLPSTKQEVADYDNYLLGFTKETKRLKPEQILETPSGIELLSEVSQNLVITNLNLNLAATAEHLFSINDLIHYADTLEAVILIDNSSSQEDKELFRKLYKDEPEINIIAFRPTGEKYLSLFSNTTAEKIMDNELKNSTLIVKEGYYDILQKKMIFSDKLRHADVVLYNTVQNLHFALNSLVKINPQTEIRYAHIGTSEGNPLQTLMVMIDEHHPILIVNAFGNVNISKLLTELKSNTTQLTANEIRAQKRHLNNALSVLLGVGDVWRADWIETMLDGSHFHAR